MEQAYSLEVNGVVLSGQADPRMPLLWLLRERGLTGTRYGCGAGLCGACTVWLDGTPVHSCDTPAWAAEGKRVTTIEGLTAAGPHPVQRALIDHEAGQCGYCLSGIVMRAAALVDRLGIDITEADVTAALEGHLCRCGVQRRVIESVLEAARSAEQGEAG